MPRSKKTKRLFCPSCGKYKAYTSFNAGSEICVACTRRAVEANTEKVDPRIKAELAGRELARRRFEHFVRRVKPNYKYGWCHVDISHRLQTFMERVERGENPWLLIKMPPRHGKSEQVSRLFPSYVFGRHPEWEVIHTSYAQSLPEEFSREIRDRLRSPEYQALFPQTKLHVDFQSIDAWRVADGGGYTAAGVGGGIIGKGAHVLIIDDPVKNVEEADSQILRDSTWKWLTSVASTRLAPGGGVLIIMQCWHEDDVAGRVEQLLAAGHDGFQLEVVSYAALAETDEWLPLPQYDHLRPYAVEERKDAILVRRQGEALHPERYTAKYLNSQKGLLTDREWSALYQQKPIPDGGIMFRPEQFRLSPEAPNTAFFTPIVLQAWDFAISTKTTANWTVGTCGLLLPGDILEVVDIRRFRSGDDREIVNEIIGFAQAWFSKTLVVGVEDGQIWKSIKGDFEREQHAARGIALTELVPLTDKVARARPLQARFQRSRILFRQGLALYEQAKRELLRFPGTKDDDCVDSLAWLAQLALTVAPPAIVGVGRARTHPSWRDELSKEMLARVRGSLSHLSA